MPIEVLLPALSPTMEKGKLIKWNKTVGDSIRSGDILFEVETDKAVMEVESTDSGTLACILMNEGECDVGTLVGVLAEKNETVEDVVSQYSNNANNSNKSSDSNDSSIKSDDGAAEVKKSSKSAADSDSAVNIENIENVENSDKFVDDPINANAGDVNNNMNNNMNSYTSDSEVFRVSPLSKKTAFEESVSRDELFSIKGTGQSGRVVKKDVQNFVNSSEFSNGSMGSSTNQNLQQKAFQSVQTGYSAGQSDINNIENKIEGKKRHNHIQFKVHDVESDIVFHDSGTIAQPASKMRLSISQSLTRAVNEIPTFLMYQQCVMDNALSFVSRAREVTGRKISLNDVIIKACAFAINQVRIFNSYWDDGNILTQSRIDIGFAVAVQNGVVVRLMRNALYKGISQISNEVKFLSEEAKQKSIHENYVFCISNMGGYGVEKFTATLNGTGILAVGSCHKAPVVVNDSIEVKSVMNVSLNSDHRLIDGADAANFLRFFKMAMLHPEMIML